jgi:signal transduction histidine kinase
VKDLRVRDWALAGGVFAALAVNLAVMGGGDAGAWALTAIASFALVWLRRFPWAVLVVTGVAGVLYYPAGYPDTFLALTFMAALVNLTVVVGGLAGLVATFSIVMAFLVAGRVREASLSTDGRAIAYTTVGLLAAVIVGESLRTWRAALARAEDAERTREEEARRRATEERLRIARELHDILAHQISLINVQAGAALHRGDGGQAFEALENIKRASKETLTELRRMLGVLRQYDEETPVAPAPSLSTLPDLVSQTQVPGLTVRLEDSRDDVPLPAPVELTAYRIVQESLTNVVRHSGASEVTVRVAQANGELVVEVTDNGTKTPDPEHVQRGNGLRGMRERASAVGGTVTAEAGYTGFRVRAVLPAEKGTA